MSDRYGDYRPLAFLKDWFGATPTATQEAFRSGPDLLHQSIIGAPGALYDLARNNIENAKAYAQTGEYDPKPAFDAGLATLGSGFFGGVQRNALGSGVILPPRLEEAARMARAEAMGLPLDAYHGTRYGFNEFRYTPADRYPTIDQALGPHFAKDPAISNSFTESSGGYREGGRVIPVRIPGENEMLRVPQARYETGALESDTRAIANAASLEAWKQRPSLLQKWLETHHAMSPDISKGVAEDLLAGRSVAIRPENPPATLDYHMRNYGTSAGANEQLVASLARDAWQKQGYKGLIYENTAPGEIANATDRTSYIVFDPANVRSRFALFDPENIGRRGLMGGLAGLSAVPLADLVRRE